ncbi:MAG: hypothetical protein NVS1B1_05580 [Candidatus Limnocylindrales bacterium]
MFAISYDAVAELEKFTTAHGITFPLLSDEGSRVIRELGLIDTELEAHHATFGIKTRDDQRGVPFPISFVLDADGRVERTLSEENYRVRAGGRRLLAELLGTAATAPADAPSATAREAVVSASIRLDSPTYFAYQRLGLQIDLTIAPGWHIYGPVVPDGYVPLGVTVTSTPDGVRVGPIAWPATRPFQVADLAEEFAVYDGTIRLDVPVEFILQRDSGAARVEVTVSFQACSATECFAPTAIAAALTVPEAPTL